MLNYWKAFFFRQQTASKAENSWKFLFAFSTSGQ